jgi:hypothetical protein
MKNRHWIMVLWVLVSAGCRTTRMPVPTPEPTPVLLTLGRVLHVNAEQGYVVLRCGSLPSAGEEATVFRGEQRVSRLRISGPSRPPFATADILEGLPRDGDTVKVPRKRGVSAPSKVVKP